MADDKQNKEQARELPDNVADAWAAVLIDIHQRRRGKDRADKNDGTADLPEAEKTVSPSTGHP